MVYLMPLKYFLVLVIFLICSCFGGDNNIPDSDVEDFVVTGIDIDETDFFDEVDNKAGSNSLDCGHLVFVGFLQGNSGNLAEVDACVVNAFEVNESFFAIYDVQGIDSSLKYAIISNNENDLYVVYY